MNLYNGIESTLVILRHRLKASGPRPEIQVVQALEPIPLVECYPSAINQVLMNLLVNAIDALESVDCDDENPPPTIAIAGHAKTLDNRPGIEISITDNGPGIPPEKRDRLCDPFFYDQTYWQRHRLRTVHQLSDCGGKSSREIHHRERTQLRSQIHDLATSGAQPPCR